MFSSFSFLYGCHPFKVIKKTQGSLLHCFDKKKYGVQAVTRNLLCYVCYTKRSRRKRRKKEELERWLRMTVLGKVKGEGERRQIGLKHILCMCEILKQQKQALTALAGRWSIIPGIHILWLTTACNCSKRSDDLFGSEGTWTHLYIIHIYIHNK